MKIPAFSLEYFRSVEMALSLCQPTVSVPPTPRISHTPTTTYGSAGSAEGQWGREAVSYSAGTTPPSSYQSGHIPLERVDSQSQSYSTSPEHHRGRSNASLTSVFAASLSRNMSNTSQSSPPPSGGKKRTSPVDSATGSLAPGGVTWGTNTFFAAPLDEPPMESSAAYSDSEEEYDEDRLPSSDGMKMRVTLKNQDVFDGEGSANIPLLNPNLSARYRGYRENYANLLAIWRLEIQRLEVLKINGLQFSSAEIQQQDQSPLSTEEGQRIDQSGLEWQGLHIESTANIRRHNSPNSQQQQNSLETKKKKLTCSICNSLIQGIYAPCFHCGHVWHSHCHQLWFNPTPSPGIPIEDENPEPEPRTCPTGCGCPCTKYAMVNPRSLAEDDDYDDSQLNPYHPQQSSYDQGTPDIEENFLRRNWEEWGYLTSSSNSPGRDGLSLFKPPRGRGRERGGLLLSGGVLSRSFNSTSGVDGPA